MGRPSIVLSETDKKAIKLIVDKHSSFNWVYYEVQKSVCKISEVKLRQVLKDMGIDKFTRNKTTTDNPNQISLDNTHPDAIAEVNTNKIHDSNKTELTPNQDDSNEKNSKNLSQDTQQNTSVENTYLDKQDSYEEKSSPKHQSAKEEIDASQEDQENICDENLPPYEETTTEEKNTSTESSTEPHSDVKSSSTTQIPTESFEALLKKIDILSNDIIYLLKQIDIIKAAILPLTEKNPDKTISLLKDDFIKIYADQRASTTINLNVELKEPIKTLASKFAGTKNFSDAVNLALLIALYSEYGEDIR